MDPQAPPQPPLQTPEPQAAQPDIGAQIASAVTQGKNILVTVGSDPSVDELAAALGLTILLGKLDKHVTAVFSGKIPSAIEFLDPKAVFENSVDSLRDFIIALDKEKADKLRYKVEDDVVKVFITPYRTILSEKDLQFSQGDFNVDVVIALGVQKREELDAAIVAHGRILHDATVITINTGLTSSGLGAIDWNDPEAGSVAEMLVTLSSQLGTDLLDEQSSTALLTGIVAETNRFSNEKTSPKVMTMAAQLMAAGANQQLIATNLRQEGMLSEQVRGKEAQPHGDGGEMVLTHGKDEPKKPSSQPNRNNQPQVDKNRQKKAGKNQPQKLDPKASLQAAVDAAAPPRGAQAAPQISEKPDPQMGEGNSQKAQSPKTVLPPQPVGGDPVMSAAPPPAVQEPPVAPVLAGSQNVNAEPATQDGQVSSEQANQAEINSHSLAHEEAEPAVDTGAALEEARQAVEAAAISQPFSPGNQPIEALNAQPLPEVAPVISETALPVAPVGGAVAPVPEPVIDITAAPSPAAPVPTNDLLATSPPLGAVPSPDPQFASPVPSDGVSLPPMPPLPPAGLGDLPPMPPLPGQPGDPVSGMQPPVTPGFAQDMSGQNAWSQTGDDLAAQAAEKQMQREEKLNEMTTQYDTAVDRNRELQGLQPLNNPNGSGLPPVAPPPVK